MPPWKKIVLVSFILLLDLVAFLFLAIESMSYGDVTHLLEDKAYQRFECFVTMGWWFWWGINAATLAVLLYRFVKQNATAYQQLPKG